MAADGILSAVANILEKDILPTIQNFLPKESMLLDRFSQNAKGVRFNNNTIYFSATVGAHTGVATQAEGGDLAHGKPTYNQMNVTAKTYTASHTLSWQAMKACKGQPGALADIVTAYGMEAKTQLGKDLDRQFCTYGEGVITSVPVGGGATSTTLPVNNAHGIMVGESYEVGTKAQIEAGTADTIAVSDVDYFNNNVTIGSTTFADSDLVVRKNCHTTTTYYEMMGIAGLVDNATFTAAWQGVTRSGASYVNSYVESTATALVLNHVTTLVQMCQRFGRPDFLVTSQALQNKYAQALTAIRRIVNSVQLVGGWSGLAVVAGDREVPMAVSHHLPTTSMYGISESEFKFTQLEPVSWLNEGEGVLHILPASTGQALSTQYQAALIGMGNLICFNPRSSGCLLNKTTA